ncbi:MAG: hypothetical protein KDA22_13385 [Phycisphaerales bacterium]|nr:hypothetical protein [Phycisphaerales bacterium]
MRDFRLRTDLQRSVVRGFSLPLGIEAVELEPPAQGYTIAYTPGEEDDPDTYAFHAVVSIERLRPLLRETFALLPREIYPIIEIGSRDAYRSVDVYLGEEPIARREFLDVWNRFEDILIEDASIGVGANAEEPFIEVFVDSWKGLSVHVPLHLRDTIEEIFHRHGLEEVPETWGDSEREPATRVREVLEIVDEQSPDIDELLLQLRELWRLELNVDPQTNVDEAGRNLGMTLWHAVVVADSADGNLDRGAYLSVWADAGSMADMEDLIDEVMDAHPEWSFTSVYSIDRVAYDERPDELAALPPRPGREPKVHLVQFDIWGDPPAERRDQGAVNG